MEHQKQIALAYETTSMNQTELAVKLTQLGVIRKGGRSIAVSQPMVSNAIKAVNRWREARGEPLIETRKGRKAAAVDPAVLDLGPRQDGKARRQRPKKK